jgi:hypothetical protein
MNRHVNHVGRRSHGFGFGIFPMWFNVSLTDGALRTRSRNLGRERHHTAVSVGFFGIQLRVVTKSRLEELDRTFCFMILPKAHSIVGRSATNAKKSCFLTTTVR